MKSSVPVVARGARVLLQDGCSTGSAAALRQFAAGGAVPPPGPGAPVRSAAAARQAPPAPPRPPQPPQPPAAAGAAEAAEAAGAGGGGGGGSRLLTGLLLVGIPAGAYYAYDSNKQLFSREAQGGPAAGEQEQQQQQQPGAAALVDSLLAKSKQALAALPAALGGGKQGTSDSLGGQKQRDEEAGFTLLPPGGEAPSEAAAGGGGGGGAAAAHDSLSTAADEFPGSTAGAEAKGISAGNSSGSSSSSSSSPSPAATEEDASRIIAAMSSAAAAGGGGGGQPRKRAEQQQQQQQQQRPQHAAAVSAAAAAAAVEDTELDALCRKLGVPADITPAGLIAAANAAGLGASSSSGAPLPPQMAQLNQAAADARLLGGLLQQLAARQAQLEQQLAEAQKEKEWAEEAAKKREDSLTEHFKELMREQSRIQQQITERAVREAEDALVADTSAAQLQERRERGAIIDELRARVNALALAFDARTAQVKSAHEVNKVSLGVLALGRALEAGEPIGQQLQVLAAGCPGDLVVEAVAASLPGSASSSGLPTMRQLQQQFAEVSRAAGEAAYFSAQEGEGGVLAHLVAKLAVKLKVDAGPLGAAPGPDAKLSQARALLREGKLMAAADALSAAAEGTQAAGVVAQWVEAARARAVADQAVALLQAHATTIAVAGSV